MEATRYIAQADLGLLRGEVCAEALAQGWATAAELEAMAAALEAWGEDRDAYRFMPFCCAIGWR